MAILLDLSPVVQCPCKADPLHISSSSLAFTVILKTNLELLLVQRNTQEVHHSKTLANDLTPSYLLTLAPPNLSSSSASIKRILLASLLALRLSATKVTTTETLVMRRTMMTCSKTRKHLRLNLNLSWKIKNSQLVRILKKNFLPTTETALKLLSTINPLPTMPMVKKRVSKQIRVTLLQRDHHPYLATTQPTMVNSHPTLLRTATMTVLSLLKATRTGFSENTSEFNAPERSTNASSGT